MEETDVLRIWTLAITKHSILLHLLRHFFTIFLQNSIHLKNIMNTLRRINFLCVYNTACAVTITINLWMVIMFHSLTIPLLVKSKFL